MDNKEFLIGLRRSRRFLRSLQHMIYSAAVPLQAGYYKISDFSYTGDADCRKLTPIQEGEIWGKEWDKACFRFQCEVPSCFAGRELCLCLDLGGELLLYDRTGTPVCGMTDGSIYSRHFQKNRYRLSRRFHAGEKLEFRAEAWASRLNGIEMEMEPQLNTAYPEGHLECSAVLMRLCVFEPEIWQLSIEFDMLLELAETLGYEEYRARSILSVLSRAIAVYGGGKGNAGKSRAVLKEALEVSASASMPTACAVGHAHIDIGYLWEIQESRGKAIRTFASQLELMQRYPDYVFGASQPQLYQFVKESRPDLFEKIRTAVKRGCWELQGGMWVEADTNLIDGESMIRQFLHGKNFFKDEFGIDVRNLWLPDVFGYSAALPQIIRKTGCEWFMSTKISWNQFDQFPYHIFWWEGIDHSRILAHFPPCSDYNAPLTPGTLMNAGKSFTDSADTGEFLYLFGMGDGGGGPTEEYVERGRKMASLDPLPKVRFGKASSFFHTLLESGSEFPVWSGELYLELHRGTLTTQAAVKRGNRKCEQALNALEFLYSCLPLEIYPGKELDRMWKILLKNQFHDILPGSAIGPVYKTAEKEHSEVLKQCKELFACGASALFISCENAAVIVNSLPYPVYSVITLPIKWTDYEILDGRGDMLPMQKLPDKTVTALSLPPSGAIAIFKGSAKKIPLQVPDVSLRLENEQVCYDFSADGTLIHAHDKEFDREILSGPGNLLSIYRDNPVTREAWDIDFYYRDEFECNLECISAEKTAEGPLVSAICLTYRYSSSRFVQQVSLRRGSKRLDFDTRVDWHEDRKMLRVAFPAAIIADHANFDIASGWIRRSNHSNTSWERAQFEVSGHQFADLSDNGYGVALLNDCKYGYRVKDNTLELCLLRSPKYPDFYADRGKHRFVYSLLPHENALENSDVFAEAAELNRPPILLNGFSIPDDFRTPCMLQSRGIKIACLKKAEKEQCLILRLAEFRGKRSEGMLKLLPGMEIRETDMMEWDDGKIMPAPSNDMIKIILNPFEIKTFKLRKADHAN